MSALEPATRLARRRRFDEADFVRFLEKKADEDGRWELIDGIPIQMPPATLRHQRIAANLERLLYKGLEAVGSDLDARREAGLRHPSDPDFRPVADVVVIDPRQEEENGHDRFYDRCVLVAEVLSPSTEHYDLIWKRPRYVELPFCEYVLLMSQIEMRVRFSSRENGFVEQVLSAGDTLAFPFLQVSIPVEDLYRGVSLS